MTRRPSEVRTFVRSDELPQSRRTRRVLSRSRVNILPTTA